MIIIHEIGHLFAINLFNFKVDRMSIYPFGGNIKYNALLNTSIYKELIILLCGALFQIIFYLIIYIFYIKGYINESTFKIIKSIHYYLLIFNFLPIIPLDGGKLLNLILDYFISYKKAHIITIITSIITIIVLITLNFKFIIVLLLILLIKSIIFEIKTHKLKINKFLLERLIYRLNFKKGKTINDIYKIKRGKTHKIKKNNKIFEENEYLQNLFDLNI